SYDDVSCARSHGFSGSDNTGLVAVSTAGRTHAGCDDREAMPELSAQSGRFLSGSYDALTAVGKRESGGPVHLIHNAPSNPNLLQSRILEGGQHGDGEHQ